MSDIERLQREGVKEIRRNLPAPVEEERKGPERQMSSWGRHAMQKCERGHDCNCAMMGGLILSAACCVHGERECAAPVQPDTPSDVERLLDWIDERLPLEPRGAAQPDTGEAVGERDPAAPTHLTIEAERRLVADIDLSDPNPPQGLRDIREAMLEVRSLRDRLRAREGSERELREALAQIRKFAWGHQHDTPEPCDCVSCINLRDVETLARRALGGHHER